MYGRGDEARGGLILKTMRHEVELLIDKAQAVEDHRLHRLACSDHPYFRVLLGGFIADLSDAEFLNHPRHKAQVIYNLTVGSLWHARSSSEEILLASKNYSNFIGVCGMSVVALPGILR